MLWRIWDKAKPAMTFLLLNPSKADEEINDPTITRCWRRAERYGLGGMRVVNLFAWRSTSPDELYIPEDPIGPENDSYILEACRDTDVVLCGWGGYGKLQNRGNAVLKLLLDHQVKPMCLGVNKDDTPKHPLYVRYDVQPIPYVPG